MASSNNVYEKSANFQKLTDASLEFAFDLYRAIVSRQGGSATNLVMSPLSIGIGLAMLYHGSSQKTAEELKETLKLDKLYKEDDICSEFESVLQSISYTKIRKEKHMDTGLINWLYLDENFKFLQPYERLLKDHYQTRIGRINFARLTEDNFSNVIPPDLLAQVEGPLALVNALFFNCEWQYQFEKASSRGLFHMSNAKKVVTNYMRVKSEFFYAEKNRPDCKVLELPYAGSGYKMYVILPNGIQGLSAIETFMTRDVFRNLKSSMRKTKVDVSLPKFKLESRMALNETLKSLGTNLIFSPKHANLERMAVKTDNPLYLSAFLHTAGVEVGLEGVWAANELNVPGQKKTRRMAEFRADHPFLFVIHDTRRDIILFMGRLTDPNQ